MTEVWGTIKKWGAAIAAGLLFLIGMGWLWRRKQRELGALKDELAVANATKEISRLTAVREETAKQVGEKDQAIEEIDAQLAANKRAIVEAHEGGEGLTDEEMLAAFARLGL